jgi:DNA-binding LytR/AlgR family response regulator
MNTIIIDDDDASREMLSHLIGQVENLKLTGSYSSGRDAIPVLKSNEVQLVFLDVEMPEMSGLELLAGLEIKPMVIITSSHKQYAVDAFEHEIVDYLLKPVLVPRFLKAVTKAEKKIQKSNGMVKPNGSEFVFIRKDSVIHKIPVKDILWVEAMGDYVTVHTRDKKYILHQTLKSIEAKLPAHRFIRVHRSFIVQVDNIKTVEDTTIYVDTEPIPLGALFKEGFYKRLGLLG